MGNDVKPLFGSLKLLRWQTSGDFQQTILKLWPRFLLSAQLNEE